MEIWNTIVSSNTFNFLVMVGILFFIAKKIDITSVIENALTSVKNKISDSEKEKADKKLYLQEAHKSVENLDNEIEETLNKAKENADNLKESIISSANLKVEKIKDNIEKTVEMEEKKASSELILKTAERSKELALQKICKLLEEKPELHEKIIDRCIEKLGTL